MSRPFFVLINFLAWITFGESDIRVKVALFVMTIAIALFGARKGWIAR